MDRYPSPGQLRPRLALRTSHWLHSAIALAAISVYILGAVAHTKVSSLPPDFDIGGLTYPVAIGQFEVDSEDELLARVAGEPVGYPVALRSSGADVDTVVVTQKLYTSFHDLIIKINETDVRGGNEVKDVLEPLNAQF